MRRNRFVRRTSSRPRGESWCSRPPRDRPSLLSEQRLPNDSPRPSSKALIDDVTWPERGVDHAMDFPSERSTEPLPKPPNVGRCTRVALPASPSNNAAITMSFLGDMHDNVFQFELDNWLVDLGQIHGSVVKYHPFSCAAFGSLGRSVSFFFNERWVHVWNANHIQ